MSVCTGGISRTKSQALAWKELIWWAKEKVLTLWIFSFRYSTGITTTNASLAHRKACNGILSPRTILRRVIYNTLMYYGDWSWWQGLGPRSVLSPLRCVSVQSNLGIAKMCLRKKMSSKTLHMTSSNVIRRLFATQAITTFARENAFERRRWIMHALLVLYVAWRFTCDKSV